MTTNRTLNRLGAACAVALAASGCTPSDAELERAVRTYVARVEEAYRTSDPKPIEPVTGVDEGRRLTALIGVKRDMGVSLDAQLLDFKVTGTARAGGVFLVSTEERWYYQDRRIGTGERVGQDSTDRYWMRYRLVRSGKAFVVEGADFERPPEVGRKETPSAGVEALHGVMTHPSGQEPPGVKGSVLAPKEGGR